MTEEELLNQEAEEHYTQLNTLAKILYIESVSEELTEEELAILDRELSYFPEDMPGYAGLVGVLSGLLLKEVGEKYGFEE